MLDFAYLENAKECPFCGDDDIAIKFDSSREDRGLPAYFVECQNCFASTGYRKSELEAIENWHKNQYFNNRSRY